MLVINSDNTVSFSLFSQFSELLCVMSTRSLGDLNVGKKPLENALPLLDLYGIKLKQFVTMNQVHQSDMIQIEKSDGGSIKSDVDGLVTAAKEIFLGVKVADCVPLFFYDPVLKSAAVVHAGWRGTLGGIAVKVIKRLQDLGSDPKNVLVAIGPHIGGCCYTVKTDRAEVFRKQFPDTRVVYQEQNVWHVDLGLANKIQLLVSGVQEAQIDAPIVCTNCQNERFLSFRKEGESCGRMLGIIGIRG